jgi:hypothetical protein
LSKSSLVFVLSLVFAASATPALSVPVPPVIEVKEITAPPKLDGVLDDACWQGLPEYTDFTDETTKNVIKPPTFVRICRDANTIYVAFHAVHPDPKRIPASEKKRNGNWHTDDCVLTVIDSTHAHRAFSNFMVNAHGTQFEKLEGGSAGKIQWRGDWKAAAKVVDDGYNVEMAIPFSLLKFDKNQKTFGICFERWFPNEHIWASWPDMEGDWDVRYFADWQNVCPPWIKPKPVVLGYAVGTTGGSDDESASRKGVRAGFDIKYPFASNMLGLLSYKPDFSTIEQAVESVDFSYTQRVLPDYRPFFQEWDLGAPPPLFYSRNIEDFDLGTKFVGKQGPHSFGLLNAMSVGEFSDTLLRYTGLIGPRSGVGLGLADHSTAGHRNTVGFYSAWGGWKQGQRSHDFTGGIYTSNTTGAPSGNQWDVHYNTDGGNGSLHGGLRFAQIDPTYNTELGLESNQDERGWVADFGWSKAYRERNIRSVSINVSKKDWRHLDGSPFQDGFEFYGDLGFAKGRGIGFSYDISSRNEFHDLTRYISYYWNGDSANRNGSVNYASGRRANGDYSHVLFAQNFRVGPYLALGVTYERSRISEPSPYAGTGRQFVTTINYDLTNEKSVGGRIVMQNGKTNLYLAYRQQVRKGMDIYIIYGDPNSVNSTGMISVKVVQPIF